MTNKERVQSYKDRGDCASCGKRPFVEGKVNCRFCIDRAKTNHIKRLERYKVEGLCIQCGRSKEQVDMLACDACLLKGATANRKRISDNLQQGLCRSCGSEKEQANKRSCNKCLDYAVSLQKATAEKRSASYLCVTCGSMPADWPRKKCVECFEATKAKDKAFRQKKIDKGLCPKCKSPDVTPPFVHCSICRDKQRAYADEHHAKEGVAGAVQLRKHIYHLKNREVRNANNVKRNLEVKRLVIAAYGGKCACCGEDGLQFLSIDHINGDGADHRRELKTIGAGHSFYRYLLNNDFPDKHRLTVLCHSCNVAKGVGIDCPHKLGTVERVDKNLAPTDQMDLFAWRPTNA